MRPEQKEKLVALIQSSPTLREDRKAVILKAIELLTDDKADRLIKLFVDAQKRYAEIEQQYSGVALDIKKQFLEKANEFTSNELTELFHEWEAAEHAKEEAELAQIEKEIDKLPGE